MSLRTSREATQWPQRSPALSYLPGSSRGLTDLEEGRQGECLRPAFGVPSAAANASLGHVVASSDQIREVHNSFSKTSPFSLDPSAVPDDAKEDAYHFITYLPVHGLLYELDGLQASPIMHAPVDEGDGWLDAARDTIQARIDTYPPGSVMFNLLAVRADPVPRLQAELAQPDLSEGRRFEAQEQLSHEQAKRARGAMENSLRRHNILPVVLELFKALADSPDAQAREAAIDAARDKGRKRREAGKDE